MESVRNWLKNRHYKVGVSLYIQNGNNDFLKELFQSQQNSYTESKLYDELSKLCASNSPEVGNIDVSDRPATEVDPQPKNDPNQFLITKLQHELRQVYRSIDNNRFQLLRAKHDKTRKEYAFQIINLHFRKLGVFAKLDHYDEHGTLPPPPKECVCATDEIQRLYVQIWKAKKRLEQAPDKIRNKAKTETLLAERIAKLEQLKSERGIK